jgi:hypothetical protein
MTLHITFWPTNFVQKFFWRDEISYVFIFLNIKWILCEHVNEVKICIISLGKYLIFICFHLL